MSWNPLGHDQLYPVRHNSSSSSTTTTSGGQDYYRYHYQQQQHQQQQRRFHSQPMDANGEFLQDNHEAKMMKLDGSASLVKQQQQQQQQQQRYQSHYGGASQSRVRSIQPNRYYQHQQSPIRLAREELKENDLLSHRDAGGRKESNDATTAAIDQLNQHLVKTISDLPIFVTIEDFRVASYTIAGEPHLCLPQLLQFLRQHFDTKRMVEKFEESLIHFPSASPKQVEGFVKSSCLPPSAKSCPLIKRSDADKICLSLFEELSNSAVTRAAPNDIISLRSQQQQHKHQENQSDSANKSENIEGVRSKCVTTSPPKEIESSERSLVKDQLYPETKIIHEEEKEDADSISNAPKISQEIYPDRNIVQQEKNSSVVVTSYSSDDDKCATAKKKLKCNNDESDATKSDSSTTQDASEDISRDGDKTDQSELSQDKISPTFGGNGDVKQDSQKGDSTSGPSATNAAANGETLFETEAQSSILNFARAATSTLMIRVYHKCFGKCIGSFYPSLLKNKQQECIQCTTCKVMLTPRRFVGHTHGSKESEVCHWGFNSYNWRSYIRLSKKQPQNNLDEDELLNQFNTLSTSADMQADPPSPPAATISQVVPIEKCTNFGLPFFANTSAAAAAAAATAVSPNNYWQNFLQSRNSSFPTRIATSDRHRQSSSSYASASSDESPPGPQTSSNFAALGHNTSISVMRRFNTTDESSSLTLHAPSSSSSSSISGLSVGSKQQQHESASQYLSRHASSAIDDRCSARLARSASLSGGTPSGACCGSAGAGMMPSAPNRLTPQHSQDYYGLTGTTNPYTGQRASNTVARGLFSQPDQLTGDLRDFLLHNWSTQTNSHPQAPPQAPAQLSMLPLGSLALPVSAGQPCNPLQLKEAVTRPIRSNNEDLTKHLSLSAESKRELYVCTNLNTYLSRRGLSAGMTGDIVEKVLNLMRESRLTTL